MRFVTLITFLLLCSMAIGQKTVTGVVTTDAGDPMIGVNIIEVGTSNGTISDIDGTFSIDVQDGAALSFSFTGYETQEIAVGNQSSIQIEMTEGSLLDEVVVTALGIAKSKKALSYSITEVDAESFAAARANSPVQSLSGKVAGVNVSSTATGAGGSTRVIIRGNNSISGANQPLYVVDGVPIDNTQLGSAGMWGGQDWGDGVSSLNPDDIESVTVLKGTSAAALYGYRSANGVIQITTKSGSKREGVGVEFNSQYRTESLIDLYDFQTEYGHGIDGIAPTTQEEAMERTLYGWGGRLNGSNVVQFDGVSRPYSDVGNNLSRFYRTGKTFVNTLTLTGGGEDLTYRLSGSNLSNNDILPNSGLDRRNITLRVDAKLNEKLRAVGFANYIYEDATNRPRLSDSPGNANFSTMLLAPSINVNDLQGDPNKLGANEDGTELLFNDNVFATNPWWATHQFGADNTKNRLLGKLELQYDIYKGLYARGRIGLDRFNNRRRNLTPYGTAYSNFGQLTEDTREVQELNTELILGYNGEINENIGLNVLVGGNQQRNKTELLSLSGSNFNIPFLHSIGNLANQSRGINFGETQVNSLFGSVELALNRGIYINSTVRNDWFSTLTLAGGDGKNDQVYYSLGLSASLSDLMTLPNSIDFLKLRGSFATGSGPGAANNPYVLSLAYRLEGQGHLGNPLGRIQNTSIPNSGLVPLLTKEFEAGFDLRMFTGRLNFDFTYYTRRTENDIINASVGAQSGFGSKIVNLGEMTNKGVELLISAVPYRKLDFTWETSFNLAHNTNEVISLLTDTQDDEESIRLEESRTRSAYIEVIEGLPYSQITGWEYARDASGNLVLDENGYPTRGEFTNFGTGVHPTTMGWSNSFSYKNFKFSFLIDMQRGGKIYSATNSNAYSRGLHQNTLEGRDSGIGVVPVEEVDNYYSRIASITEEFVYDADFIKLREMVLNYRLPQSIVEDSPFSSVTFGIAGRNLWLISSKVDNFDPESTYSSGNGQGLELAGVPQTRSFQFNVGLKF